MHLKSQLDVCVLVLLTISFCNGYQVGKGKFESYNGNRYTEAKSLEENSTKTLFGLNRKSPPAHDTPASPCSCSKFPYDLAKKKQAQCEFRLKK
jgi:hypothetical protein